MVRMVWVTALLAGCGSTDSATWLEGFGYEWAFFNHRLSHATFQLDERKATVAVIGGTSTTQELPDLDDSCDPETCDEFPFFDESDVFVQWAAAEATKVQFAQGQLTLNADADGAESTVTITLDRPVRGDLVAIVNGLSLDTDHPVSTGESCYNPRYGWHLTQLQVTLGTPTVVDRTTVDVPVTATVKAGNSLEEERRCVDLVAEYAIVPLTLDVLLVATTREISTYDKQYALSYPWNGSATSPEEQPPPDLSERKTGSPGTTLFQGWSAFDFQFYPDDPTGRGAYLRRLELFVDPAEGVASGHANNYSPGTQLAAFDYAFSGTVVSIDLGTDIQRGRVEARLPTEISEDGSAILHALDL